jgi:hypothetical protein
MIIVKSDFDKRKAEFEQYKYFITQTDINSDIEKILKSNAYLIAYNTVESTITNLLFALNEAIKNNNSEYMLLTDNIKKLLHQYHFNGKTKFDTDEIKKIIEGLVIGDQIIIESDKLIKKLRLFSGDLDHRKILVIFKKYGINNIQSDHSEDILKVKNIRNRLAHGEISYSDCCRSECVSETLYSVDNVFVYLEKLINTVKDYINNKKYLCETYTSPP